MDSLASDQVGFRDVDSESLQLMSVRLVLLGWHKSKDSDRDCPDPRTAVAVAKRPARMQRRARHQPHFHITSKEFQE